MDVGKHENEVQTDVKLLLECLKCQVNNQSAVKQALLTLSSIFSTYDFVKEYFKDIGGLLFLMDLLTSVENCEVQERALFCLGCAIERNVFCQKSLTTCNIFKFIQTILSRGSTAKVKQAATFFLINLVSNNGEGQVLVKQSQCLSTLIELLSFSLPINIRESDANEPGCEWFNGSGPTSVELWTSVVNALCVSINNPQNEENQKVCGLQLPFILKLLEKQSETFLLARHLMFLLGFVVSNNKSNQDQVRRLGGLDILCTILKQWYEKSSSEVLKEVVHIITTIDSCISDNADSANMLGKSGAIQILANVIHNDCLDTEDKIKVTITLGHAMENSATNRKLFLEAGNSLQDVVHILTSSEDEELVKALKYVLQISVQKDPCNDRDWQQPEPDNKGIGENILKKINDLSMRLHSVEERECEFTNAPKAGTLNHFESNKSQPCMNINSLEGFKTDNEVKNSSYLNTLDKSELLKQSFENCVTQSKETLERKQRLCESSRIDSPAVATNTVQRTNGDILQQKVQNTGLQSPNSSDKSFDVDLSEMTPKKNTKHIGSNNEMTKGEFKVPLRPPPKRRSSCTKLPSVANSISDVESDHGFSDIQSEFDWKLLSGASYETDGRGTIGTPSSVFSVIPVGRSTQLYKTPETNQLKQNRFCFSDPRFSVQSVNSIDTDLQSRKGEGISCRRKILHTEKFDEERNCIGCSGINTTDDTQLNSRTINIVLETDPYTCLLHRQAREVERSYIQKMKSQNRERPLYRKQHNSTPRSLMVYEFSSESEPEVSAPDTIGKRSSILQTSKSMRKRRHRIPYSQEEVDNLLEGVQNLGKFWCQILAAYKFHPSRTAVDLMEKFKRLSKTTNAPRANGSLKSVPFSMCEERRLMRGVMQFGYSWKTILNSYKFANVRTAEDLRNRWRSMNK